MITDTRGVITYYNKVQAEIDGLTKEEVIGRHVTEVYVPHPDASPILASMRLAQPIFEIYELYETRKGRVVNSTHTTIPLIKNGRVRGCVCLIHPLDLDGGPSPESRAAKDTLLFGQLIGSSPPFVESVNRAMAAADSPSSVLLFGETGSGKELLDRRLHDVSKRAGRPYVAINCSAIPASLLEGLLFGTVKGAFTGAVDAPGLIEEADGGTIFLDELDSMPLELQPKLLRVIQERLVRRLGSGRERAVSVKIISSFSVEPLAAVESGRVRADLYYRLGVVVIRVPPLRERMSDLTSLLSFFINKHQEALGKKANGLSPEVMAVLKAHDWPGNVRELENVVEGALNVISEGQTIGLEHLPPHLRPPRGGRAMGTGPGPEAPPPPGRPEIVEALTRTRGSLKRAAGLLGVSRQLLAYRLRKYGIERRLFEL
jgi:arginine utilization regulatory protein